MNILKNYFSTILLLTGVAIGGICGIIWGPATVVVKPIGDLFLNLMFVLIVPLVFLSVSSSMYNMKQTNKIGKVIGSSFLVFVFMSLVAACLSYAFIHLYNPLEGISSASITPIIGDTLAQSDKALFGDSLVQALTVPDFHFLLSKSNLLPLIVFSVLFGLASAMVGEKGKPVADFLNSATAIILKIMDLIMHLAPIGLGCYFASTIGSLGAQVLNGYMHVLILFLLLTFVLFFIVNSLYMYTIGGTEAFKMFWKNILSPSLTAVATASSAACISINIESAKKMGVPGYIAETVIPLGTNLHKDGSVITGVMKIMFLITVFGAGMHTFNVFTVIGLALLVGIVVGAIPSGGMTGELLVCSVLGFPPELAGVLLVIATIVDIPATMLNSTGNIVGSLLVTRLVEGKKWLKKAAI